ncbi:MAG TPA: glucans biosynthesis glucosyltransferase MdoH [Nevskiaceae bacterium]|nr:glucans biosynthesis glucosyltransferase MdoH [Nevskiaceae bacterium]
MSRLSAYIDRLPLEAEERARLLEAAALPDPGAAFHELHAKLAGHDGPSDPVAASAGVRLRRAWTVDHKRGDVDADRILQTDVRGMPRLVTVPPVERSFMTPKPWDFNPVARMGTALRQRFFGMRGRMRSRKEDEAAPEPDLPHEAFQVPWRLSAILRRLVLVGFILAQTYFATYFMTAILPYHGQHWLEVALLVIYAILFAWVGAGFWTALMGFWVLLLGRDKHSINNTAPPDLVIPDDCRTAILVPICNEDVTRVFAGIRATYDSLARTGERDHFDFFFLSDTSQADIRVAELEAWLKLCRAVRGFGHIFYRRRTNRIRRKSGNVADWCRRWGSRYRYMIVLDADSVMSGPCIKRLVQLMEANPRAGIIQTAPRAAGRDTLYARIQQFATRMYGPLFTAGLHFWQLGESHYWGHNAILRVAPFMRHCALGRIPGRGPLAGEILSHDFVEAALMRRAGWTVWIAYDLPGSYEEMPPALLDELKRDRRWCQGNLQNFQLFTAAGLHPAHRAVFMTGVMAYLSAPLWFLFLVLSTALLALTVLSEPVYFTQPNQLFPSWPEWHPEWAVRLFGATALLLFLPKFLAALVQLIRPRELRGFGGPFRMLASVFVETLFSSLLAPIRMLFHTKFVVGALLGWALVWKSPPRGDNETTWTEALSKHGGGTVLGVVWAVGIYWLQPKFLVWLLPVVGSLMLSIPLSVWSSRVRLGRAFRELRLFLIPEESMPPRELRWLRNAMRKTTAEPPGFHAAVVDPVVHALTSAYGTPRDRRPAAMREQRDQLIERAVAEGPGSLNDVERNILLYDPLLLGKLHARVWTKEGVHESWHARGTLRRDSKPG